MVTRMCCVRLTWQPPHFISHSKTEGCRDGFVGSPRDGKQERPGMDTSGEGSIAAPSLSSPRQWSQGFPDSQQSGKRGSRVCPCALGRPVAPLIPGPPG